MKNVNEIIIESYPNPNQKTPYIILELSVLETYLVYYCNIFTKNPLDAAHHKPTLDKKTTLQLILNFPSYDSRLTKSQLLFYLRITLNSFV